MAHTIEAAPTGRATCRGCGARIAAGVLRAGEKLPNAYGEGAAETTYWFHVACAAYRRPEVFLEALAAATVDVPDRDRLRDEAALGVAHRRLPRASTSDRAPTGRATCRACRQPIAKGEWRIALLYYEEGRFMPSGYLHAACAAPYFETATVMPRLRHFSPDLSDADAADIDAAIARGPASPVTIDPER